MKLNELTQEVKDKLYQAESLDECMKIAQEYGIEVTREEAEKMFAEYKPKLSQKELESVVGGIGADDGDNWYKCKHCGELFDMTTCERRNVDAGCGTTETQLKCPECGEWN